MSVMIKFHKESLVDRRLPWIEISLDYKTIFSYLECLKFAGRSGPIFVSITIHTTESKLMLQ